MAFEVEEIDLTEHRAAGKIALKYTPLLVEEVAVDPIGGPAQVYQEDFIIVESDLVWDHPDIPDSDIKSVLGSETTPGVDVTVRVMYER